MKRSQAWLLVVLIVSTLPLAACGQATPVTADKLQPATIEKIGESELNRVVLTEKALQRLDVQMAAVREEQVNGMQRKVIPYAAVIYGLKGETWAYTSPQPLTFVRQPITIDYIEDDIAVLVDGPPVGSPIVTVGAAELYGVDTGVK